MPVLSVLVYVVAIGIVMIVSSLTCGTNIEVLAKVLDGDGLVASDEEVIDGGGGATA